MFPIGLVDVLFHSAHANLNVTSFIVEPQAPMFHPDLNIVCLTHEKA
jgi:hypothetical protein